uniref:Zinc finger CCCH-type, RNA binding motif and serine/arginine rich 2 n=1 Tax=Equus asinus TaxID=9793 RepID=A0A9L0J5V9_EQUAS
MVWGEVVIQLWGNARGKDYFQSGVGAPEEFSGRRHLFAQGFGRLATYRSLPSSVVGPPWARHAPRPGDRLRGTDACAPPRAALSLPLPAGSWGRGCAGKMAAPEEMMFPGKLSHRKYRAALKKEKRKKRRQELARLRDSGLAQEEEEAEDAFREQLEEEKQSEMERCSRKHNFPASSPTLLIRSMFTTFGMEQCRRDDYDPDASLEYSEEETYQQFLDFYDDVLPEFKNVGKVIQFKVSCNLEPHLRGNVYVQYQSEEECQTALSLFNGRWYAGRQLQCEFCPVTQWKMAICGLFEIQQCPRGKHCNFLHVFRNPNNEFWEANRDIYLSPDRTGSSFGKNLERRERMGHHDKYYGRPRRRRSPSPAHSYKRNGQAERKRRSSHRGKKSHKHTSKSRERHSSRSRGRKRDRSRGRSSRSQSRRSQSRRSRSQSSSRSRSRGGQRSGSRDRTIHSPKSK